MVGVCCHLVICLLDYLSDSKSDSHATRNALTFNRYDLIFVDWWLSNHSEQEIFSTIIRIIVIHWEAQLLITIQYDLLTKYLESLLFISLIEGVFSDLFDCLSICLLNKWYLRNLTLNLHECFIDGFLHDGWRLRVLL